MVLDGETWPVAVDVCAVLGHTNTGKAVSRLDDDDEKGATTVRTPWRTPRRQIDTLATADRGSRRQPGASATADHLTPPPSSRPGGGCWHSQHRGMLSLWISLNRPRSPRRPRLAHEESRAFSPVEEMPL